jgi:uncharacterized protein YfeS
MKFKSGAYNLPGPGDEATWGPCTGHPGDPRTPDDSEAIAEKQLEMVDDRIRESVDWVIEAFQEDEEAWEKLRQALLKRDSHAIGEAVTEIITGYVEPSMEEALEALKKEAEEAMIDAADATWDEPSWRFD